MSALKAIALLLFGAVACSSPPAPRVAERAPIATPSVPPVKAPELVPAEPCEAVELPADPSERGRTIEALVQTATERDAACVVRAIEQSYPGLAVQSPPPSSLRGLRKWWEIVGSRAQRYDFAPDELVVLPELPRPLSAERRATFEHLLCKPTDPESCGLESRAFLAATEQQLWTLSQLQRLKEDPEVAESDQASKVEACAQKADGSYDAWQSCVRRLVPTRLIAPSDAFRLPERGILETSVGGYWSTCLEARASSVSSGVTLTRRWCWMEATKTHQIRYGVERVDPKAVKQVALFIAISKDLQTSPASAQSFTVPSGLEKETRRHLSKAPLGLYVADAIRHDYELHGVLGTVPSARLFPGFETEPERRLLLQLLEGLDTASEPSCATPRDKAELIEAFEYLATVEENLEQTLESVACPR